MKLSFWEFIGTVLVIRAVAEGVAKIVRANKESE